jgi:hypothetical protein
MHNNKINFDGQNITNTHTCVCVIKARQDELSLSKP